MKVTCKTNRAKEVAADPLRPFRGETSETIYDVSIGREYSVSAVAVWESAVILLVLDDTGRPNWYSTEIFSITDPRLPANWLFSTSIANEHGLQAILGYPRMISDPNHYEALIERDSAALEHFYNEAGGTALQL